MPALQITDQRENSEETDVSLLAAFVGSREERAFEALVQRHAGWVQAVACRSLRDKEMRQEVTQNVFIHLARKAAHVKAEALGPWLHRVTVLECRNANRRERLRQKTLEAVTRETDHMKPDNSSPEYRWRAALPLLDDAVNTLPETARTVVVQRFLQQRSWREIGEAIGRSEDSARMALGPALNRLARVLRKRGIAVPVPALAAVLSASGNLTGEVCAASLTKAALAGSSTAPVSAWWSGAAAAWLSTAACLVAGTVAGYRFTDPGSAAPAEVASVPSGAAPVTASARAASVEAGFDLAAVLDGLRALKPSGNDVEFIVHLRAALLKMPPGALPQVLAAMRKRTWGEDSRGVVAAFFYRWAVLDIESAWAASRDPDFLGAVSNTTRALLQGAPSDDPAMFVRLINTLPETEAYPSGVLTVAAKTRLGDLPSGSLIPLLNSIKSFPLRRSLILGLIKRPLTPAELELIAPVAAALPPMDASMTVPQLSERWYQTDPASFHRWKETLPPNSSSRWAAILGEAGAVSGDDPAEGGKLVAGIPWTWLLPTKLEAILNRWIETDPAGAGQWLSSSTMIPAQERERLIARANHKEHNP
ncbi:MAG TPA: sigma-70 family RNA polymerase sigma factor [Verrucomicrobiales bacterium]|nr:sigma-70 family RNA polymerase sigma factor [Verrucomicrobiales bacterium]